MTPVIFGSGGSSEAFAGGRMKTRGGFREGGPRFRSRGGPRRLWRIDPFASFRSHWGGATLHRELGPPTNDEARQAQRGRRRNSQRALFVERRGVAPLRCFEFDRDPGGRGSGCCSPFEIPAGTIVFRPKRRSRRPRARRPASFPGSTRNVAGTGRAGLHPLPITGTGPAGLHRPQFSI
jgi:hypothetical protein